MRICLILGFVATATAFPQTFSIVPPDDSNQTETTTKKTPKTPPQVYSLRIESLIKNRYAKTRVVSRLANPAPNAQEVTFDMALPETAFISSFILEIDGKKYKAYVKEKEEAKREYDAAVAIGITAAHVELNVRDSNRFTVSVNVEASKKVAFILTYEELLVRTRGLYNHLININPRQVVKDLQVDVYIAEKSPINKLFVPELRALNAIVPENEKNNSLAEVTRTGENRVHVHYAPSVADQEKSFGTELGGQLAVQYDVDRTNGSQILVNDGYFVHFFSPEGLKPLRKMAVFVLDVSGSMDGRKIEQLKRAMKTIIDDLGPDDYFNLVDFSYSVTVHDLDSVSESAVLAPDSRVYQWGSWSDELEPTPMSKVNLPKAYPTTPEYKEKAKVVIRKMSAGGGTNIYDALKHSIIVARSGIDHIRKIEREQNKTDSHIEPIIVFLTDGDPTVGMTNPTKILSMVKEYNIPKSAIFSLGFGSDANMNFLRRISLSNSAFARRIYEASDAALQLKNFYKEIASPLLSNVTFKYTPDQVQEESLTLEKFPTLFYGSEFIVAGKVNENVNVIEGRVDAIDIDGLQHTETTGANEEEDLDDLDEDEDEDDDDIKPRNGSEPIIPRKKPKNKYKSLERLWAYLTIQQLVDKIDSLDPEMNTTDIDDIKKNATALALKYKFVSRFTSLVVVKPNQTSEVPLGPKPEHPELSSIGFSSTPISAKSHITQKNALYPRVGNYPVLRSSAHLILSSPLAQGPPGFSIGDLSAGSIRPLSTSMVAQSGPQSMSVDRFDANEERADMEVPDGFITSTQETPTTVPEPGVDDLPLWFNSTYDETKQALLLPFGPDNTTLEFKFDPQPTNQTFQDCEKVPYKCQHLASCVQTEIVNSVEDYRPYFCVLADNFAGVCCVTAPIAQKEISA